jgi:tetratricopeptide (TPR) repeat protein
LPAPTVHVFVSSTWLDLRPEREAVERVIHRTRETKFLGMEYFGSRDETTRRTSLDEVDRSQLYVGIFAARYGSGITEAEYRRASERDLPCPIYFKDSAAVADEWRDADPAQTAKLDALKQDLRAAHIIAEPFNSPDQLAALFAADLHRWLFDHYLIPILERAARRELPRDEAQPLLDATKDFGRLNQELLTRLSAAGYAVAGAGGVAIGGGAEHAAVSTGTGGVAVASAQGDVFAGNKIVYEAPALAISALHQLPPPPRDFTGREAELAELLSKIGQGGVAISGLQGLGGIGKTALALKLAEQLKARYPDAQFYLDLKGASPQPLTAAAALAHVVRAFHPTAKLPEDEAQLRALYLSVLSDRRALLLMDNAAGREQVEPLDPPGGCVLLVTSRTHFTLPGMFAKRLDALLPADARQLLLKIAPRIGERADEIAELCGHLPLALRMAAGALAERVNLTPIDYLRRLADAQKRLALVEASLTLSYDLLSPDLQKFWRTLAVFPGTFDTSAAAAVWETDADAALDTLGELIRYSLVEWDESAARYHLHDLARLFADARQSAAERDANRMRHATYFLGVTREAQRLYRQGGEAIKRGLELFDLEWKNIQAGRSWAVKHSHDNDAAAALCSTYPAAGISLLNLRQHSRENIVWLEAALDATRQLKDLAAEGICLGNLGYHYDDLGEYRRAIEFYEQSLTIARELGDRRNEGANLILIGVAYKNLGEMVRAIEYYEQGLTIAREVNDRRAEGQALGNLGNAYRRLGEPQRAVEFQEQALVIDREFGDRRGEGDTLSNLGNSYLDMGKPQRAIEFYEQRLTIARELGDRRGEGNGYINISLAFDMLGDRTRALAHAEAALEIFEQIESPHVAMVRAQIAVWRGQG